MPTVLDVRVGVQGNCHGHDGDRGFQERDRDRRRGWEDEQQLQQQFPTLKGFAFNVDKQGMMEQQADLFKAALKNVDVTSIIYGMTHPIDVIDGMDGLC